MEKIYDWARARYVAPWAVFFGVLLRVAACVPPSVQLPPVIGGRASLNLLCAFVGRSGTGKGNSAKVAALAWPSEVLTLPIGSGQGIAETFTKREAADEIQPVIFDVPEIDTFAGLATAQGSVLLPTVKSLAMGEQLGQANATKESRRNVPAHSYRACLSVGAQPGHTDIIFGDTTGGTPQRFLWASVTDPNIPDGKFNDPNPLETAMPPWTPGSDGVTELAYTAPEIERSIVEAHIARQRGHGDALDGHALLTRCKVAALLAIMHKRVEVTDWDWRQSGVVMAVSDETRRGIILAAESINRQRQLDAGVARAVRSEGYEAGRVQIASGAILEILQRQGADGMARNDLRTGLSKANRNVFDSAVLRLVEEGKIDVLKVRRGERFRLKDTRQGGKAHQGFFSELSEGGASYQGGKPDNVVSLERHTSKASRPEVSCQKWFDDYLSKQRDLGHLAVEAVAVREAGIAAGYSRSNLYVAANKRGLKGEIWKIAG